MWRLRQLAVKLYHFLRPARAEQELTREVAAHLGLLEDEFRQRGMTADAARLAARRSFGGVEQAKERSREERSFVWLEDLRRDLRIGARMLRKVPGFAAVAILTLALGIGATTAIFTVVNGVLLKPLPFDDPDKVVAVVNRTADFDGFALSPDQNAVVGQAVSLRYLTYRGENRVFEDIGVFTTGSETRQTTVTGLEEPERVVWTAVTAGLLPLLRVQPVLGRRFTEEDDSPGAPWAIMLSHAYWQRHGSDPALVGTTLRVEGVPMEIIGVLPPDVVLQDISRSLRIEPSGGGRCPKALRIRMSSVWR